MPKSAKIVLTINSILMIGLLILAFQVYMNWQSEYFMAYLSAAIIGGLFLCQLVIMYKGRKLWNMLRAILYILALLVALFLVASLADLFTLAGFLKCLGSLLLVLYLIGLRGYLNAKEFLDYLR
ncbi:hypothetical protein [Kangiella sp. TOML190]|uniref:hypothetical protein n=1 Tax=Kangiella sp. TOML190 TaxID=2931351 RepID=UPI00203AB081|nr:hypothetical protein [Kangiella sp. TOML190]